MGRRTTPIALLLMVVALLAAACGGSSGPDEPAEAGRSETQESDDTSSDDAADADGDEDAAADDEGDDADASSGDDAETAGGDDTDTGAFRIGIVAPSSIDDVAFTQSMADAVDRVAAERSAEVDITPLTFDVGEAAIAIRGYAEEGYDLVIAHGSQYGDSVAEIAADHPDVAFAWGTATDTFDLPNVSAYTVAADEGGYVLGTIAAAMHPGGSIGIIGPLEVGDARLYIEGFSAGATDHDSSVSVSVEYIGSFSDVVLAGQQAVVFADQGVDVLTGSAQMVAGATVVATENGIDWFGSQSNQTRLAPEVVVASQVYRWEVILEPIIAGIAEGDLGGESHVLGLANDGIAIEYNDATEIPTGVRALAGETVRGLISGAISTGVS